jgi:mono/diheme cytochrome c family protein
MRTTFKSILSASLVLALTVVLLSFFSIQQQPAGKAWDIPAKYKVMKNPSVGKNVEIGKSLWAKHCKSCHGNTGIGDGPKAKMLKTFPGDYSSAKFQSQSDGVIYYQTVIGRDEMPNFEKKLLTEEDRWAMVNFIRTLKK